MSRVLFGLLRKELREHGWVLAALAFFIGGLQGLLVLGSAIAPRTITMLETHASFVRLFLPIIGVALGRRLVVREYYGRTQRFLEALPIPRGAIFAVKLTCGLAVMLAASSFSLAVSAGVAAVREPISIGWLAIIAARTFAFTLALWAVFFSFGFLGRWRVPAYLLVALAILFIDQVTELEPSRIPPFSLVNDTFVLERFHAPFADLAFTVGGALLLFVLAGWLALGREGTLAQGLARPMSRTERVAATLVLGLGSIFSSVIDPATDETAFAFDEGSDVVTRGSVDVLVGADRVPAELVAARLDADLRALASRLGWTALPRVHVALRNDLTPHRYDPVELDPSDDAVLVRAHYVDDAFDVARFSAYVMERVIDRATDGRARHEAYAWVRAALASSIADPDDGRLVAFYAHARRPDFTTLERWNRGAERFGAPVMRALAHTAGRALEREAGSDGLDAFARSVLERDPAPGVFAAAGLATDPIAARLERTTGLGRDRLADAWAADVRAARAGANVLLDASLSIETEEGSLRTVVYRVVPRDGSVATGYCALLHTRLGRFDDRLDDDDLEREEAPCAELAEPHRLVARYSAGERAFFAIERDDDGWPTRLLAERRTLP
ncbi:MAG: ABC transporter permease [Sandaracinaceae bacterium]